MNTRRAASFALMLALLALPIRVAFADHHEDLVLGRISDDPATAYAELKPLLDYVVPRMANVGIKRGKVLLARDLQQMLGMIRRDQVDWVAETMANGSLLVIQGKMHPIYFASRNGSDLYHSVIFVRKDSPIQTLSDMRGRRIAFQSASSTSSFFAPASVMRRNGLQLQNLASPFDEVDPHEVGYVFAGASRNIGTWVHKQIVDAGALSNLEFNDPKRMPKAFRSDMRVIGRSRDLPRAMELVNPSMSPKVRKRLEEVLRDALTDPMAKPALKAYYNTTQFRTISPSESKRILNLGIRMQKIRKELE